MLGDDDGSSENTAERVSQVFPNSNDFRYKFEVAEIEVFGITEQKVCMLQSNEMI